MQTKVLKSYTIVPNSLYVHREADRQLSDIIEDMGRPGYVLVARQMGKTNMLLNAKRNLTGKEDVFVYVDLTNSFSNARECFRYIIDVAVETHIDKLNYIYDDILLEREKGDMPDHLEHTQELRKLLRVIRGKVVIILDEIDALTKVSFSDTIFKQIRSTYFSRVNFPELERLTYVLSGVAEPANLIKDPKISPFNIGKSIFLGDFSYDEFLTFIEKSQLSVSNEVADRIFYWVNGNPRMTYDVCSSIEDMIRENRSITIQSIDSTVAQLYLQKYDHAPIDHIRELVENDSEIYESVLAIKQGAFDRITNSTKRKLYLSGIIGSNFDEKQISIKNRVIDEALSEEWLSEISADYMSIVNKANSLASEGLYVEGILLLENALESASGEAKIIFRQLISNAYYSRKQYEQIVYLYSQYPEDFSYLQDIDKRAKETQLDCLRQYAFSLLYTKGYREAIDAFSILMKYSSKDINYFQSLLLIGASFMRLNDESDNALFYFNKLINDLNDQFIELIPSQINELRTLAYYNLGKIVHANGRVDQAVSYYLEANEISIIEWRPTILFALAELDENKRQEYIYGAINIIMDNNIKPQHGFHLRSLTVNYKLVYDLLFSIGDFTQEALTNRKIFITYIIKNDPQRFGLWSDQIINEIYLLDESDEDLATLVNIHCFIILNEPSAISLNNKAFLYNVYKYTAREDNAIEYSAIYAKEVAANKLIQHLTPEDIALIWVGLRVLIDKGDFESAQSVIQFTNSLYPLLNNNEKTDYLMVDFFEMVLLSKTNEPKLLFEKSRKLLREFNLGYINADNTIIISSDIIDFVKESAQEHYSELAPLYENKDVSNGRNRNTRVTVKYTNGKVVTDKYKRLSDDIIRGICKIVL